MNNVTKNTPMIVERIANGFIVRPYYTYLPATATDLLTIYGFHTMDEVLEFMKLNFTEDKDS
jgi:hypothetical protein